MTDFVNTAAPSFDITHLYCTVDNQTKKAKLTFVAIYTGAYSKEVFAMFIDRFRQDQDKIKYMKNYEKIFLE
jgi:hypothetical protein